MSRVVLLNILININSIKSLATAAALLLSGGLTSHAQTTADVIVYGSTPGGFCAAIAAARTERKRSFECIMPRPVRRVGAFSWNTFPKLF